MSKPWYFFRGLIRIAQYTILPVLALNIVGYWFIQLLPYISTEVFPLSVHDIRWPSSYPGRAALLSAIGFLVTLFVVGGPLLIMGMTRFLIDIIMQVGGYREDSPSNKV